MKDCQNTSPAARVHAAVAALLLAVSGPACARFGVMRSDEAVEASAARADAAPAPAATEALVPAAPNPAIARAEAKDLEKLQRVSAWCKEVGASIRDLKWQIEPCEGIHWQIGGASVRNRPLVYTEFGDPSAQNVTLILAMVHGDEVTPLYLGLKLAHWVRENPRLVNNTRVVIAPLVNPDSFFSKPRTRTNARGVDVNRNFPTADWNTRALQLWKKKFGSNPRRFPGKEANSEPETLFQQELIRNIRPSKILSIHAPLNFMDYDGPSTLSLERFPKEYVQECLKLRSRLKATPGGFFPGSLGNYAGQELGIPTFTLELPTAEAHKADRYWMQFRSGVSTMIEFKVPDVAVGRLGSKELPSRVID